MTIEGRVYRWSTSTVEVLAQAGTLLFRAGLRDLTIEEGAEPTVEITDESVDWAVEGPLLDGAVATLRRQVGDQTWESARVYAFGEVSESLWGGRFDPAGFRVGVVPGPLLGTQVPDAFAVVSRRTWPVDVGHVRGEGGVYPVIFGYPGFGDDNTAEQIVPLPLGQWKEDTPATTYAVVSEDPDAPITELRVRNDDHDGSRVQAVSVVTDGLGRRVLVADMNAGFQPSSSTTDLYGGFRPSGGGGLARTAYEVVGYVLRRWGPGSFDPTRLPEVADLLSAYLVDTWINDAQSDPWAWLEDSILPDLPVSIRVSARGRYLAHRRYRSDPSRLVGTIEAGRDAFRLGTVRREGPAVNEWSASYRRNRDGEWLGQVVLTGTPDLVVPVPGVVVAVEQSGLCLASAARWGRRPTEEPLEIDWTWDEGTVRRVLGDQAERWALPAVLARYEVADGEDLNEGDEVTLVDDEIGLDRPVIVDGPPTRGITTTVTFRVPG